MNLEELLRVKSSLREISPHKQLFVDYYTNATDENELKLDKTIRLTEVTDALLRNDSSFFDEVLPAIYAVNIRMAMSLDENALDTETRTLRYDFLFRAADVARRIFEIGTGDKKIDIQWGETSYFHFLQAANAIESENKYKAARAYHKAARVAKQLYDSSDNLKWLSKSLASYNYAAYLMFDVDMKESAYLYARTAQRASELYDRNVAPGVLKIGIDACNFFFSYYKSNPIPDWMRLNGQVQSSWRILTSKK